MTYQDSSIQEKGRQGQNLTDLPVKCQEGLTEPCDGLGSGITMSTNKTMKHCSFKKSWQDKTRIHKPSFALNIIAKRRLCRFPLFTGKCLFIIWAQLFKSRLALNPGLKLIQVSFSCFQKHFLG